MESFLTPTCSFSVWEYGLMTDRFQFSAFPLQDLAAIGIGPFNLSVAALLDAVPEVQAQFFDRSPRFAWHPGMMLPDVTLQTSWLKDLVSAVQPTSPFSFTSYLVARRRFYEFITAGFEGIYRREFDDYLGWVAAQLPSLHFGTPVESVDFDGRHFVLTHRHGEVRARNVLIGTGHHPYLPRWAAGLEDMCLHTSRFAEKDRDYTGRHVIVVGGGQSGAEIVLDLLRRGPDRVGGITWITRRMNFSSLDEVAFSNEYFTPAYVARFHGLPPDLRARHVAAQKLASDGASPTTLNEIYRALYQIRHLDGRRDFVRLMPYREAEAARRHGEGITLHLRHHLDGQMDTVTGDTVICATGYKAAVPACFGSLQKRLKLDEEGRYTLRPDFSAVWDGPASARIFVQNAGRHSHGIAEPQLSLMAWRAATIINSLLGRPHFDLEEPEPLVDWGVEREDETSRLAAE
ncbi:L-lysine 6-monooxygenase [Granulibacter bethesdensis CGDNIH1]|uniref:L-lysine 6-monooxygenase n=2 Tax=Granulibacter bethesdensis TaxID=364410 RepID=Q0BPH9_GRABC|nr:L-lysine 6-monooxygenase [Granulibacter bethesdensis CGDNIH1]APH53155.1 L-lysine 6-monooxygenase [Granulibacter bethesdensis]APH65844.1 L-lysine 6-monooxygenase [Granulibacter bethesdensis]